VERPRKAGSGCRSACGWRPSVRRRPTLTVTVSGEASCRPTSHRPRSSGRSAPPGSAAAAPRLLRVGASGHPMLSTRLTKIAARSILMDCLPEVAFSSGLRNCNESPRPSLPIERWMLPGQAFAAPGGGLDAMWAKRHGRDTSLTATLTRATAARPRTGSSQLVRRPHSRSGGACPQPASANAHRVRNGSRTADRSVRRIAASGRSIRRSGSARRRREERLR